jgi:hypothetical protein
MVRESIHRYRSVIPLFPRGVIWTLERKYLQQKYKDNFNGSVYMSYSYSKLPEEKQADKSSLFINGRNSYASHTTPNSLNAKRQFS